MLVADPLAPRPDIQVIAYGPDAVREEKIHDVDAIRDFPPKWPVTWVNVDGLGDASVLATLGEIFDLHRLAMEDVLNVHQRPKVDQYDTNYFVVARMIERTDELTTEQLSMFLGSNYVITFQERPGDCFDPVRERIRKRGGKIRHSGPDYLAYALLDAFVDNYFPVLEEYGEQLEELEGDVVAHPTTNTVARIQAAKRRLLVLRRAIWPLREAVNVLSREESPLISSETRVYLRDCYDHTIQLIDILENFRDIASSLMDVYLSSVSNHTNEIMKVLTIVTTIFIPLTLVAGIYGMNFNTSRSPLNMPELNWYWGYPFALGAMAVVALVLLAFFRRRGWLGSGPPPRERSDSESGAGAGNS
jgi:magnesium transporter